MDGYVLEKTKDRSKGMPSVQMQCAYCQRFEQPSSELDYENVGCWTNIGMRSLPEVALLNRMADEWGLDTISLGNTIGF